MCGLLTSFHERLLNINFLLYNNRVHLEKGNNSLSTHAQLGEHNEKELYNNQQDEGGGDMIGKHYTRGGGLKVMLHYQSVGGSYLFQDKYSNHVSELKWTHNSQ